jgi:hypothetical protein
LSSNENIAYEKLLKRTNVKEVHKKILDSLRKYLELQSNPVINDIGLYETSSTTSHILW